MKLAVILTFVLAMVATILFFVLRMWGPERPPVDPPETTTVVAETTTAPETTTLVDESTTAAE